MIFIDSLSYCRKYLIFIFNIAFSFFTFFLFGVMPLMQSYKIIFDKINANNYYIDNECLYFNYFSKNQAIALAVLGIFVLSLISYAVYKKNIVFVYFSFAIAVLVLFGFAFGGCIIGK